MTDLSPRALAWQGMLPVDALWLDPDLLGESALRQRVLALWSPDCVADRLHGGVLLRFSTPRRLEARAAPGVLLCRADRVLWAAPLTPAERAQLAAPPGSVVLLRAGAAVVVPLSAGASLDPSDWLDTAPLLACPTTPLGAPPPPPAPAPEAPDIQARLGVIPSEEVRALFGGLSGAKADGSAAGAAGGGPLSGSGGGGWSWNTSGMAASALRTTQGWMGQAASSMGDGLGGLRSLFQQGERWLDELASRMGVTDALNKLADQQGARHLRNLLGMLDRGSTEDALRHAIPLNRSGGRGGGEDGGALAQGLGSLFGWGSPHGLDFSGPRDGRVSPRTLGERLFARLEELYRAAFARLDAEGNYRRAAYVLAELLDEPEEAVRYLEEKGEFTLAAELAEAKRLDVTRIAQLWLKAGNHARVLLMLRLTDRFADMVKRLEEAGSVEEAGWLRRRWAQHLAHAGRFGAAVEVLWPLEEARDHATGWLDQAIRLGGVTGAQAVGRKLALRPDLAEELRTQIRPYLADDSLEGQSARVALARVLSTPEGAPLARPLLRRLLLEQASAPPLAGRWEALRALAAATDPALEVDLPDALRSREAPVPLTEFTVTAEDTGVRPVLDAGVVRGGRALLALGEGGCLLLGSDGRPEHHFSAPAAHLVLAESGVKALALVQRGLLWQVTHLDLAARQEQPWPALLRLDAFTSAYDGDLWFVSQDSERIVALDAQRAQGAAQVLWVSQPMPSLVSLRWSPRDLFAISLSSHIPPQVHRYALPGPTRHQVLTCAALKWSRGSIFPLTDEFLWEDRAGVHALSAREEALLLPAGARLLDSHPAQGLFVAAVEGGVKVFKRGRPGSTELTLRFHLHVEEAKHWRARLAEDAWVFFDDRGRVVCVRTDGPHPALLMSARVQA